MSIFCAADYDKLYEAKLTKTLKKFTSKPTTQVHLLAHIQCTNCVQNLYCHKASFWLHS